MEDNRDISYKKPEQPMDGSPAVAYEGNGAMVMAGREGVEAMFRALDPEYRVFKDITAYAGLRRTIGDGVEPDIGLRYNKRIGNAEIDLDFNTRRGYAGDVRYGDGPVRAGIHYDSYGNISGQTSLNIGNAQFMVNAGRGQPVALNASYNLPSDSNVNFNTQGDNSSGMVNKSIDLSGTRIGLGVGFNQSPNGIKSLAEVGFGGQGQNGWYGNIGKASGEPTQARVGYRYNKVF
jgi:hypothetical protein